MNMNMAMASRITHSYTTYTQNLYFPPHVSCVVRKVSCSSMPMLGSLSSWSARFLFVQTPPAMTSYNHYFILGRFLPPPRVLSAQDKHKSVNWIAHAPAKPVACATFSDGIAGSRSRTAEDAATVAPVCPTYAPASGRSGARDERLQPEHGSSPAACARVRRPFCC
jgi:hypothetical protein